MLKTLFKYIKSAYVVMFLRTFALVLIVVLIYIITLDWKANISLIAALGILVSALLASYSVILNIDTNMALKNREISNQIRFVFFHLCLVKMRLIALEQEKYKQEVTFIDFERIMDSIQEIDEMISKIEIKEIVAIVHNNVLVDLQFLFLNISTYSTIIKSMRSNIIRPKPQVENKVVLPNPLNRISFNFDVQIEALSRILTYLREGYKIDFPGEGGIEECAQYTSNKLEKPIKNPRAAS